MMKIWKVIKNIILKKEKMSEMEETENESYHVYNMMKHRSWGDRIQIFNWDERRICGWLSRIPKEGDRLRIPMKSDKIAEFKIINIEKCGDPPDMFFADIEDIDYID